MPYDKNNPVICVRQRSYNETDPSKNGWACNLHVGPKKQNNKTVDDENNTEKLQTTQTESLIGITFMYEPYTGVKDFQVGQYANECSMAECLRDLTIKYSEAQKIHIIVCEDDYEQIPSLEQIFSADEALKIYLKLEIHRVPNSARWLNLAEDEAIACVRKLLNYGVTTMEELTAHLYTWQHEKTYFESKINLRGFRRAFSKVYKPMGTVKSEEP